jgi:hypothetical protein
MKKKIIMIGSILLTMIMLVGCSATLDDDDIEIYNDSETYEDAGETLEDEKMSSLPDELFDESEELISIPLIDSSFEGTLLGRTTDVVIAQYMGHHPFGEHSTEYEFLVTDSILREATGPIFVYVNNDLYANIEGMEHNVDYLLPLMAHVTPYSQTQDASFFFTRGLVINLDNPSSSRMNNQLLSEQSSNLDFNSDLSREEIISYVREVTKDNELAGDFIRSIEIEDIINESPYVLHVEVNESLSLFNERVAKDYVFTDIYYATVIQVLKGDIDVDNELVVVFFADTVFLGEQHIIAVEQVPDGSFYQFTSRDSLFSLSQLDEIMAILGSD